MSIPNYPAPNPTGPRLVRALRLSVAELDRIHDRRRDIGRHLVDIAHGLVGLAEEGVDTDHLLDLVEMTKATAGDADTLALDEAADVIRAIAGACRLHVAGTTLKDSRQMAERLSAMTPPSTERGEANTSPALLEALRSSLNTTRQA